jgi:hypothetical protein
MRIRHSVALPALLLFASIAFAQREDPLRTEFRKSLTLTMDSCVAAGRSSADSLMRTGDEASGKALALLDSLIGALVRGAGDSLDGRERNALHVTELGMRTSIGVLGYPARARVRSLLRSFERELPLLMGKRSVCEGCTRPSDFASARSLFRDEADSLSGVYADSIESAVRAWEEAIDDSVVAFTDSVQDEISTLTEAYAGRRAEERVSRLVAEGSFQTHANYRGRDNGFTESVFGPSLSYHHAIGLVLSGAIAWGSSPTPGPDDGSLGVGYEFDMSPAWDGSVTYTRYWYSAASTLPRSATNQSLEGITTLSLDALTLLGDLAYDFGGGSGGAEFTVSLDVGKDLLVPGKTLGGTLTISPTLGAVWGDQDERLLERRIQKVKKKSVIVRSVKPAVIFGIMAYDVSLPARLTIGNLSIEPLFEYVIPADVLDSGRSLLNKDPSTSVPYVSCTLTATMTIE